MKRIFFFFLFFLSSTYELAQKDGKLGARFIACGYTGMVLFANLVLIRDALIIVGIEFKSFPWFPDFKRSLTLLAAVLIFGLLCYISFLATGLFNKSQSKQTKEVYKIMGFQRKHAVWYAVLSFVFLFLLAFLKGGEPA